MIAYGTRRSPGREFAERTQLGHSRRKALAGRRRELDVTTHGQPAERILETARMRMPDAELRQANLESLPFADAERSK